MESKACFYTKRNTTTNVKSNTSNYLGSTGSKCGRWNPTSEQVKALTELFRSGLRTPTTDQIQNISTQLSFYGKIESKNVFYWFQNHKARERHKRSLKVLSFHHKDHKDIIHHHHKHHISSTTSHVVEVNNDQVPSAERVMDTLQLFPLSSFEEEAERFNSRLESATAKVSYTINATEMPLDLRLSFM